MNSNICLFHVYKVLNGVFTSLIDLYFNLSKYFDIDFYIIVTNYQDFLKTRTQYPYIPFKIIKFISDIHNEYIITNPNSLYVLDTIPYKKYIVLDSRTFLLSDILHDDKNNILQHDNFTILGNQYNSKFFTNNYHIYYHKFSIERLEYLKNIQYSNKELERKNFTNISKDIKYYNKAHEYNSYSYKRYAYHIQNGQKYYFENVGKLIFEYSYLSKKVLYSPENKSFDDGLTEYLRLFNIDDSIEQEIKIDKNDIVDKLTMKHDDLILSLI